MAATATWSPQADAAVIALSGPLDRNSVPALWQERAKWLAGEGDLTLHLADVEKVDSAGVALLIQAQKILKQQRRTLKLQHANRQLRAIVEVSGVADLLNFND